MVKQLLFSLSLILTLAVFLYTTLKVISLFRLTQKSFPIRNFGKRILVTLEVAIGQTKILRSPLIGLMHALVFWGFCVILIGSIEMVTDGLSGGERTLRFLGPVYDVIVAAGDIFAAIILVFIIAFLGRRLFMRVKRFSGVEMTHRSHLDANVALTLILLLMVTLLGMNTFYIGSVQAKGAEMVGVFPISQQIANLFAGLTSGQHHLFHEINWWSHILLIFFFANYLPYSKHFHVFMSVPNVFLTNLAPLGKLSTMESITREVRLMLDPGAVYDENETTPRFGVLDVEDVTWKNYLDSLACTQCGRCTSVCPANLTGKRLSPRKIIMDVRARMKDKGPGMVKHDRSYSDNKSLIRDLISTEELWACTTCNACAQECPININHPSLIVDMRRYLVMEESAAPAELNAIFSNIENNGAPWQFSQSDRLLWAEDKIPLMTDVAAEGRTPEYLFWVGSAGAFDDRYKQVTRAFVKILTHLEIDYAVLGTEESSTGDVARRAGNEMLFQMQALTNIELLNGYGIKKILTCDPHAYNTFLYEYPDLGGVYEVQHHSQFLLDQLNSGRLRVNRQVFLGERITYHDPCYLGRANKVYKAPREVIKALTPGLTEMTRNRSFALCCGAGGGQMFKEAESGDKEVFIERTEEVLATGAATVITACPYCMVMLTDGMKYKNKEDQVKVRDLAEMIAVALDK